MTPKEHKLVKELLEKVSYEAYKLGVEHGKAGSNPLEEKAFSMGRGSALILTTKIKKFLEKR